MSERELKTEHWYRYNERLAILNDGRPPEPWMEEMARAEADAWLAEQRGELNLK